MSQLSTVCRVRGERTCKLRSDINRKTNVIGIRLELGGGGGGGSVPVGTGETINISPNSYSNPSCAVSSS